jgi:hypothetical protein
MKKRMKCKTSYETSEKEDEFGNTQSESLKFKCGTPIMLGFENVIHLLVLYVIYGNSSDLGC